MVNRGVAGSWRGGAGWRLLARLGRDLRGNVLALTAATMPVVLALTGAAVDMGRAYLTQTSLQAACDAGVLASRRAQGRSGQFGTAEIAAGQKMFNHNFRLAGTGAAVIDTEPRATRRCTRSMPAAGWSGPRCPRPCRPR